MDPAESYFAAASPPRKRGLGDTVDELKQMQQQLLANRNNSGSPSRGHLLQQPIIPSTGAAPYWYVDPKANTAPSLQAPDSLQRQFQLLPPNTPNILMNTKRLPRFAGERDDLLREIDNTIYGGGHAPAPTPTPTPQTKYFPVSYFT